MFSPTPTYPTARKIHHCDMCDREILPGERYQRDVGFDGGTAWTWKECEHCQALIKTYPEILDWVDEGYNSSDIDNWEPRTWLGRMRKMRWSHKWQHGNGKLAVVPTQEPPNSATL